MEHLQTCPRCLEQNLLRQRTFSDQALAALLIWEEVSENQVSMPMCNSCYEELREVLIERASELENPSQPTRAQSPSHRPVSAIKAKKAEVPAPKPAAVAKAAAAKPTVAKIAPKPSVAKAAPKPSTKPAPAKPAAKKKAPEKAKGKPAAKKKKASKAS